MPPLPDKLDRLRVATLNLWGRFADWPRRLALLEQQLPPLAIDVYFLQEVVCGAGREDQLAQFADSLAYGWTARVIAENRPHETEDEGVAVLSRLPLHNTAVWPRPPSHPSRHRRETSIDWKEQRLRLMTLHAAVSNRDGRDAQIAALTNLKENPLLLGADLNAPPWVVRPLLTDILDDTLGWDEQPTWPVNGEEWDASLEAEARRKPGPRSGAAAPRLPPLPRRRDQRFRNGHSGRSGSERIRPPARLGRCRDRSSSNILTLMPDPQMEPVQGSPKAHVCLS